MMQKAAFPLSPSLPLVKPRRPSNPTFAARFDPIRIVCSLKPYDLSRSNNGGVYASLLRRYWSASSSSLLNFKFRPWSEVPSVSSDHGREGVKVRATSVPESASENANSGLGKTLDLGLLLGLCTSSTSASISKTSRKIVPFFCLTFKRILEPQRYQRDSWDVLSRLLTLNNSFKRKLILSAEEIKT